MHTHTRTWCVAVTIHHKSRRGFSSIPPTSSQRPEIKCVLARTDTRALAGEEPQHVHAMRECHDGPTPQTSRPTHSNVAVPPLFGSEAQRGSLLKVGHRADDPS